MTDKGGCLPVLASGQKSRQTGPGPPFFKKEEERDLQDPKLTEYTINGLT